MLIFALVGGLVIVLMAMADLSMPNKKVLILPDKKEIKPEEERVPIYHQFRRVQQALKRKSNVIEDQIKDIGLEKRELAIGNLLLEIGNKHLSVKSDLVTLDEKALETQQRENEAAYKSFMAELKVKDAQQILKEAKLQGKENEVLQKFGMLEIKEGEIGLKETALEQLKTQIDIFHQYNMIEAEQKELGLKDKELNLQDTMNKINHKLGLNQLEEKGLDQQRKDLEQQETMNDIKLKYGLIELENKKLGLEEQELGLQDMMNKISLKLGQNVLEKKELDLKGKDLKNQETLNEIKLKFGEISLENKKIDLRNKEVDLDKKDVILERKHNRNLLELGMIAQGKREVALGKKELEHAYQVKAFQLEKTVQQIKHMFIDLQLERKAWKNERKEDMLKLYHQELRNLESHIHQMYEVKMNWLKIQEKENDISYREKRLVLNDLYKDTLNKLESLRLAKWEHKLLVQEHEMSRRTYTLGAIRKLWLR